MGPNDDDESFLSPMFLALLSEMLIIFHYLFFFPELNIAKLWNMKINGFLHY